MIINNPVIHGGNNTFADTINNFTPETLASFENKIKSIPEETLQLFKQEYEKELNEADTNEKKVIVGGKIKTWFNDHGYPFLEKLSVTLIAEGIKKIVYNQ